ncbi:MAG: DUF1080 domain-containing protein [Planctomycetaceae bacterium]|nr:DUF1080 domain-containing protein [Planctomycetaceae bacterium]
MIRSALLAIAVFSFAASSQAAAPAKFPTYTTLAEAGDDYFFQGEFSGNTVTYGSTGLQVVAQGDGQFQGILYAGGLPGEGGHWSRHATFAGKRDASTLKLVGDGVTLDVQLGLAVLRDPAGRQLGVLRRAMRTSPTMGLQPPPGAIVLFDGTSTAEFDEKAQISPSGNLMHGTMTKRPVGDFRLHLEFRLPYMPTATGQARGNSGVYIQRRYEVQVLDSFGLEGVHNECGGLYKTKAPDINMCLPPLVWQTYDIDFRAARFNATGQKTADAVITVVHNGVTVQNNVAIPNKTGGGQPEGPEPLPILLQDHNNPVEYRNVWLAPRS